MSIVKERINILIGSDINYAPYYGVMLSSLFMNNKESCFDVYLLTDNTWTEEQTKKFELLTEKYNSRFFVYSVDTSIMDKYPLNAHLNLSTYYNLFAVDILPDTIHKIIYMDGDMVVTGNIRKLWDLDINDYACAMAINCTFFDNSYYERLQYDVKWGYYNNGTTLYNFDYLRNIHFSEKAVEYINTHRECLVWLDQDVQNALLHEKIMRLPITYNFQTLFFHHSDWDKYDDGFRKEVLDAATNPIVIHYCGHLKPWDYKYYKMPYAKVWQSASKKSLWPNIINKQPRWKYFKFMVKKMFYPQRLVEARNQQYAKESFEVI